MAKFDLENVLDELKTFLQSNLNTTISALNSEKNDSITLKTVDSGAYHIQFVQDRVDLADPLVLIGEVEEAVLDMQGGTAASQYRLGVFVILSETGVGDDTLVKRLLRYRRALTDVVEQYWANIVREQKVRIVATPPIGPIERLNSGFQGRAIGIEFSLTNVG